MQNSNIQENMLFGIDEFSLRKIKESDLDILLQWRNSPRIHQMMLTDHLITAEEHKAWFERMRNGQIPWGLVFCYRGNPAGYNGFSIVDIKHQIYAPGSYLGDVHSIPSVSGLFMQFLSKEYAFFKMNAARLDITVLESNWKALKINKFFGYTLNCTSEEYISEKGIHKSLIKGFLTKEQWKTHRQDMMIMLGIDKSNWEKVVFR